MRKEKKQSNKKKNILANNQREEKFLWRKIEKSNQSNPNSYFKKKKLGFF